MSILACNSLKIVDSLVIVDILRMTDESTITRGNCITLPKICDYSTDFEAERKSDLGTYLRSSSTKLAKLVQKTVSIESAL